MDDTVIFATSRAKMEQKLNKLKQSADSINMVIHPTKSKFLTVNTNDKTPFKIDNVIIDETEHYMYLSTYLKQLNTRSDRGTTPPEISTSSQILIFSDKKQ